MTIEIKECIYKQGTCQECEFANGFKPCRLNNVFFNETRCYEEIGAGKFPYIQTLY